MTGTTRAHLTGLARTLGDLAARVRAAVAGELGRAVGGAVEQVVGAAVSGRPDRSRPEYRRPPDRWGDEDDEDDGWARDRDPWADDRADVSAGRARRRFDPAGDECPEADPPAAPVVPPAVAAGVAAARWWLVRRGGRLAAAGVGLGVGLLGLVGGPVVRAAVAVLAAAADLLAVTTAIGVVAARLDAV